jgi:STE24 endopeptidase
MPRGNVIRRGGGPPAPRWVAIGATAVAAVMVAEAAAWLLRPREVIEPVAAEESAYFEPQQLERARDYRSGQRLLLVCGLAAQGAVLVLLISGRPAVARRALERASERPVIGGAAAAAGLVTVVSVAALPFDIAAHERSVDVGLSTQNLGAWATDWLKGTAITVVLAAAMGTGALALMRRFGGRWWLPASGALVGLAALLSWLAPVVLAPLFNDFDPLEPGQARQDVIELGERAGVEIGEVYRVDASRRSTALNAYVGGLGPTKRVVLYDNLLEDLDRGERSSVVAHELAHVEQRDIQRGLLFLAISAPLALLLASRVAEAMASRTGAEPGRPAFLPALALSLAITSFAVGVVGNRLSREVEAKADTEALELTDDPRALIALQRRLAERNLSDPDPPDLVSFLLGTHPTTMERIGMALAWQRESGGDSPGPPGS